MSMWALFDKEGHCRRTDVEAATGEDALMKHIKETEEGWTAWPQMTVAEAEEHADELRAQRLRGTQPEDDYRIDRRVGVSANDLYDALYRGDPDATRRLRETALRHREALALRERGQGPRNRLTPHGVIETYLQDGNVGWSMSHTSRITEKLDGEGYEVVDK